MINLKQFDLVMFGLTPENLIDTENNPLFKFFRSMALHSDKEYIHTIFQKVQFSVSGYDDDSRELFELPEFVLFCRNLSIQFPFFFYFLPQNLCKLVAMGALEAKLIGVGQSYVDPEKLEMFTERCVEHAIAYGIKVGHSEKEMRDLFLLPK